ncbi:hypothetical protein L207DRAFT_459618 [Hyaloscypha variabilis F]|uniref:BTB domain-containing protein n=1 Tax=Hyaloscypha variabilis (strain UAMH 11265 / GT02V1 / F) TaxID=1149755 RepID=A0A2J6RQP0_HYAVF|nr:hypothetical protein L207DRAFT_459618 [Hyaloscypha variabilis F]
MPASFEEILVSRPFKFIIGPDEVPIVVHEAVLAEQSPELAALMRGEMAESIAGESRWMDVDKGTFVRFAQFAYTGNYSTPKGSTAQAVVEAESSAPPQEPGLIDGRESAWQFPPSRPPLSAPRPPHSAQFSFAFPPPPRPPSASDMFNSLKYPLIESRSNLCACKPSMNDGPIESSGEVLLAHASLYVLAEKWGVNSLKMLVLSKLHQTLSTLHLDASRVQEVIDLARYAYLDSSTPDLGTEIDELRKLICLYIAANVEVVSEHNSFMDLIEGGGAFVRDLWKRVVPKKPT